VRKSRNTFATISAAKAKIALDCQTGTSFDSIQTLVSVEESVTHHLDEISLTAEQQVANRKVLSNEFISVFTHYIDEL
jgi:transcriptional regulator